MKVERFKVSEVGISRGANYVYDITNGRIIKVYRPSLAGRAYILAEALNAASSDRQRDALVDAEWEREP